MTDKDKPKGTPQELRKFGITFFVILVVIAAYLWYKGHATWPWFAVAGVLFFGAGYVAQPVLRPIFRGWMFLAFILAWVNTRVILGVFYYLILTPIGLIMRLAGKDLLDQKYDRAATTYWKPRDQAAFDSKRCERQF